MLFELFEYIVGEIEVDAVVSIVQFLLAVLLMFPAESFTHTVTLTCPSAWDDKENEHVLLLLIADEFVKFMPPGEPDAL